MSLFRLDASIRPAGSNTRELADIAEAEWRAHASDPTVVRRDLATDPIPGNAWALGAFGARTPQAERTPEQLEAISLAASLADEVVQADALLITSPLYNFGISQHLKAWVDLVITDPRLSSTGTSAIAGKPTLLVIARGGGYGPGTPREGWDHATGWITRILRDVWQTELRVVETELTLAGVNPAMAEFIDLAAQLRAVADEQVREHAVAFATSTSAA